MAGHRAEGEGMAAALWGGERGEISFFLSSSGASLTLSGDEGERDSAQESGGCAQGLRDSGLLRNREADL